VSIKHLSIQKTKNMMAFNRGILDPGPGTAQQVRGLFDPIEKPLNEVRDVVVEVGKNANELLTNANETLLEVKPELLETIRDLRIASQEFKDLTKDFKSLISDIKRYFTIFAIFVVVLILIRFFKS
jgi:hypothetical protein